MEALDKAVAERAALREVSGVLFPGENGLAPLSNPSWSHQQSHNLDPCLHLHLLLLAARFNIAGGK
jgi:hypothetical protein